MSKIDRHNFHKADACLVKAIQKYPEHAYVYETRGALQFKHDNINKAIKCFNKAIELDYKCERYVSNVIVFNNFCTLEFLK